MWEFIKRIRHTVVRPRYLIGFLVAVSLLLIAWYRFLYAPPKRDSWPEGHERIEVLERALKFPWHLRLDDEEEIPFRRQLIYDYRESPVPKWDKIEQHARAILGTGRANQDSMREAMRDLEEAAEQSRGHPKVSRGKDFRFVAPSISVVIGWLFFAMFLWDWMYRRYIGDTVMRAFRETLRTLLETDLKQLWPEGEEYPYERVTDEQIEALMAFEVAKERLEEVRSSTYRGSWYKLAVVVLLSSANTLLVFLLGAVAEALWAFITR